MAYYQSDPNSDLPQNWEEYHAKYGNKPGEPGWENLSNPERKWLKDNRSPYQSYTAEEKSIMGDVWGEISAGSPADVEGLESLMGQTRMSPEIRKWMIGRVGKLLGGGPSYQDVYKAQKGKLDVGLREAERGISETQAARGMLDSSATQARLGAAEGGYSGSLADLLMGTAQMQETARSNRFAQGLGLAGLGMDWQQSDVGNKLSLENLRNMLYTQGIGFKAGALDYLSEERARENAFNQGQVSEWDPMTGGEMIPGFIQGGVQAWLASQTGGASAVVDETGGDWWRQYGLDQDPLNPV